MDETRSPLIDASSALEAAKGDVQLAGWLLVADAVREGLASVAAAIEGRRPRTAARESRSPAVTDQPVGLLRVSNALRSGPKTAAQIIRAKRGGKSPIRAADVTAALAHLESHGGAHRGPNGSGVDVWTLTS